jgi:adenine-specific DNA-methyltransferase
MGAKRVDAAPPLNVFAASIEAAPCNCEIWREKLRTAILLTMISETLQIYSIFTDEGRAVLFPGDCKDLLASIPSGTVQLVVTSPPYNIGKEYEQRLDIGRYISDQAKIIAECYRILRPQGSICWQVGNYVEDGSIIPLDSLLYFVFAKLGMKLRNRIVWHFEHGLHCSRRLSGRYETINWFTKTDRYTFTVAPIRVRQKYPCKGSAFGLS